MTVSASTTNGESAPASGPDYAGMLERAMTRVGRGQAMAVVTEMIGENRKLRELLAKQNEAALEQTRVLEEILESEVILSKLERLSKGANGSAVATVRVSNEYRELPVHPDVDTAELEGLGSFDYVTVNTREMIVTGTRRFEGHESSRLHQLGEVAEFRSYHDRDAGTAVVSRDGRTPFVARLDPAIAGDPLAAGSQVVLHRDDPSRVVGTVSADEGRSRYETSIDSLKTSLSDLAGVESLIEELLEAVLIRVACPEIREAFSLTPLGGVMLTSRKPGMGKTTLVRALVHDLHALGRRQGFDVALFHLKPNALKTEWHGGDARNVRELFAAIRARCRAAEGRILCFVVFDEIDSLGTRGETGHVISTAQNDVVQSMLAEMDGLEKSEFDNAEVVFIGMTTREEMVDAQLRRPGRFGDLTRRIPDYDVDGAEAIMMLNTAADMPWWLDEQVAAVEPELLRHRIIRPALSRVFDTTVMTYSTERERHVPVTAGEIMAAAGFRNAMSSAKVRAAARKLRRDGIPAITADDLIGALFQQALTEARTLEGDPRLLRRWLDVAVPVTTVEIVPEHELREDRYLRHEA